MSERFINNMSLKELITECTVALIYTIEDDPEFADLSITLARYQMPESSLASTRAPIWTSAGSRRVPGGGTIGPKARTASLVFRVRCTSGTRPPPSLSLPWIRWGDTGVLARSSK